MTYKVFVDDNFHYGDESERYVAGEFETVESAVEYAKKIVDECVSQMFDHVREQKPNERITPDMVFSLYTGFGDDPFIQGTKFSAWDYARERCEALVKELDQ